MYLYLQPRGGFNDILYSIGSSIMYCRQFNRILLLDTYNSHYQINLSEYFTIKESKVKIVYDIQDIKQILDNSKLSFHPFYMKKYMKDILDGKLEMKTINNSYVDPYGRFFTLPSIGMYANVVVHIQWGGGFTFTLFKNIQLKNNIIKHCLSLYEKVEKPYVAIQIRNTDYKSNYEKLYQENKKLLDEIKNVFIATDDIRCFEFFKTKNLNVYNFTTFPDGNYYNLHYSQICPDTKIKDLFADLFIASMSDKLLSNSHGYFIKLIIDCFKNKEIIKKMFSENETQEIKNSEILQIENSQS